MFQLARLHPRMHHLRGLPCEQCLYRMHSASLSRRGGANNRCGGAHPIGIPTRVAFMVIVCLGRLLSASTRSAHTRRLLIRHWLEFNSVQDQPMLRAAQPVRECGHCALYVVCMYWLALIRRCPHSACMSVLARLPIRDVRLFLSQASAPKAPKRSRICSMYGSLPPETKHMARSVSSGAAVTVPSHT